MLDDEGGRAASGSVYLKGLEHVDPRDSIVTVPRWPPDAGDRVATLASVLWEVALHSVVAVPVDQPWVVQAEVGLLRGIRCLRQIIR